MRRSSSARICWLAGRSGPCGSGVREHAATAAATITRLAAILPIEENPSYAVPLSVEEPAGRPRPRFGRGRGKSGLHRAGCWGDSGGGDLAKAQQREDRLPVSWEV